MQNRPDDPERWREARELFLDLAERTEAERARELARLRARDEELAGWVAGLLARDPGPDASGPDASGPDASGPVVNGPDTEFQPRRLGPYETLRLLARGGMGEVYVARRVDGEFEREVAVKLLRGDAGGAELVQRFLRERQTLARLDHEYVARLLDGGTTDAGEPYLVLEYVEGLPAHRHWQDQDLPARLELFLRICAAVRHAHERGVIHRDLKPGNVVVRPDGTPRLLDFGIARPRDTEPGTDGPLTRTGHRLFTPEYASPEQVRGGEASEATDVWALGVMLYQILCDAGPWNAAGSLHDLEREICERDPLPPSRRLRGTRRRRVAGDLDTIALRCLAKAPRERYRTVGELMADLERHRDGYPILARRAGPVLRALRLARRRPWQVLGGTALVLAVAAAGLAWRVQARGERQRRELVASIEARIESARNLRSLGKLDESLVELRAARDSLAEVPEERFLRAYALSQIAVVANHQRRFQDALDLAAQAESLVPARDPRSVRLHASLLGIRSYAHELLGDLDRAWEHAVAGLEYCREELEPGHELTVDACMAVAMLQLKRGDHEGALEQLAEGVEEARRGGEARTRELGQTLNLRGLTLADLERHEEALPHFEESIEMLGWHYPEGSAVVAQARTNYGESLVRAGRLDEALEQHRRSLDTRRRLEEPERIADVLERVGETELALGLLSEADATLVEAQALRRELHGEGSPRGAKARCLLGMLREREGRDEEARALLESAVEHHGQSVLAPAFEARARFHLARVLLRDGERDAARAELDRALELQKRVLDGDHPETVATRALLLEL